MDNDKSPFKVRGAVGLENVLHTHEKAKKTADTELESIFDSPRSASEIDESQFSIFNGISRYSTASRSSLRIPATELVDTDLQFVLDGTDSKSDISSLFGLTFESLNPLVSKKCINEYQDYLTRHLLIESGTRPSDADNFNDQYLNYDARLDAEPDIYKETIKEFNKQKDVVESTGRMISEFGQIQLSNQDDLIKFEQYIHGKNTYDKMEEF